MVLAAPKTTSLNWLKMNSTDQITLELPNISGPSFTFIFYLHLVNCKLKKKPIIIIIFMLIKKLNAEIHRESSNPLLNAYA